MWLRRLIPDRSSVVILLILILLVNFIIYFLVDQGWLFNGLNSVREESFEVKVTHVSLKTYPDATIIKQKVATAKKFLQLNSHYKSQRFKLTIELARILKAAANNLTLLKNSEPTPRNITDLWFQAFSQSYSSSFNLSSAKSWVTYKEIIPASFHNVPSALQTLCASKIIAADNAKKGTQLKLSLTLSGGETALFKPKWYERDKIIEGPVYAGKDRHNGEVAAFHLSLLLDMRRVPLTVGRRINLRREVLPVASAALKSTFLQDGNNTCFYGVCYYCSSADPACAKGDVMEGALILWLPQKLTFARFSHPWQRAYRDDLIPRWQVESSYCDEIKESKRYNLKFSDRLLDIIDAAVFDFLIDNGDRHHYEMPANTQHSSIFLFDNGKRIRRETWNRLIALKDGNLSRGLKAMLKYSHIDPVLTDSHFEALDRRLLIVFAAVQACVQSNNHSLVFQV